MMTQNGTNAPSTKLTTTVVATALFAGLGRLTDHLWGWEFIPAPWVIDTVALAIGAVAGYLMPELFPSKSAMQALRRRT